MPQIERGPAIIRAAVRHIQSLKWYYRCTLMPVVVVVIGLGILGVGFELPEWLLFGQASLFAMALIYALFLVARVRWTTCPVCGGWFFDLWATRGAANRDYSERDRCNACGVKVEDMLSAGDSSTGEHV